MTLLLKVMILCSMNRSFIYKIQRWNFPWNFHILFYVKHFLLSETSNGRIGKKISNFCKERLSFFCKFYFIFCLLTLHPVRCPLLVMLSNNPLPIPVSPFPLTVWGLPGYPPIAGTSSFWEARRTFSRGWNEVVSGNSKPPAH